MKKLSILIILVGLTSSISAQTLSNVRGSFVDIGFGARPVSMGNAYVGLADDFNAVFWNPAGLATATGYNIAFTNTRQLGLIDYHYFAGSAPIVNDKFGTGVAIISSGDDLYRELTIQAGIGFKIRRLSVGVAGKYRNSFFGNNTFSVDDYSVFDPSEIELGRLNRVQGSATGFGLDVGLLFEASSSMKVGLSVKDVFALVEWNSYNGNPETTTQGSYNEDLPYEVALGVSYKPGTNVTLAMDWLPAMYTDVDNFLRIGAEAKIYQSLFIRAGTQQAINVYDDEKYMVGSGLEFSLQSNLKLFFDYTFMIEELANTHRFSLALRF